MAGFRNCFPHLRTSGVRPSEPFLYWLSKSPPPAAIPMQDDHLSSLATFFALGASLLYRRSLPVRSLGGQPLTGDSSETRSTLVCLAPASFRATMDGSPSDLRTAFLYPRFLNKFATNFVAYGVGPFESTKVAAMDCVLSPFITSFTCSPGPLSAMQCWLRMARGSSGALIWMGFSPSSVSSNSSSSYSSQVGPCTLKLPLRHLIPRLSSQVEVVHSLFLTNCSAALAFSRIFWTDSCGIKIPPFASSTAILPKPKHLDAETKGL